MIQLETHHNEIEIVEALVQIFGGAPLIHHSEGNSEATQVSKGNAIDR